MDCCQCQGIETVFSQKMAKTKQREYRKRGAEGTTKLLIDALKARGVKGMSVLDIGGGVGAIQHALLAAGAAEATSVDASSAYMAVAREEAERQGYADRIEAIHGDFVALAERIDAADVVTLDRVICCYHDMPALVARSAAKARRWYGVVYPRDTWWVRLFEPVANLFFRLQRNPFRVFIHSSEEVDAVVQAAGLERGCQQNTLVWQVVVYGRAVVSD